MRSHQKFLNDVVKPWSDLNDLLLQPYAVQSDLSDLSTRAGSMAISLSHFPERIDLKRLSDSEGMGFTIVNDLADSIKHGILHRHERQCNLSVSSTFVCNESDEFAFLRNTISVTHATHGEIDAMVLCADLINFWMKRLRIVGSVVVKENPLSFERVARLIFDQRYCLQMNSSAVNFVKRTSDGVYKPYNPSIIRFEVI